MSMDYNTLREQILARAAELINTGASGDQLAYLMRGLEILQQAKTQQDIADALARVATFEPRLRTLEEAVAGNSVLGKPSVRLFAVAENIVDNQWRDRGWPAWTNNALYNDRSLYTGDSLDPLRTLALQLGMHLDIRPGGRFFFERDYAAYDSSNGWNEHQVAVSLFIFRNTGDHNANISIRGYLSHYSGSGSWPLHEACVLWNGSAVVRWTNNNINEFNENISLAPGARGVLLVSSGSYLWTRWNYMRWYVLRHNIEINLPSSIEYDYEAYREILAA